MKNFYLMLISIFLLTSCGIDSPDDSVGCEEALTEALGELETCQPIKREQIEKTAAAMISKADYDRLEATYLANKTELEELRAWASEKAQAWTVCEYQRAGLKSQIDGSVEEVDRLMDYLTQLPVGDDCVDRDPVDVLYGSDL